MLFRSVRIDCRREGIKIDVNHKLIGAYVEMMKEIENRYPVTGDLTLEMISRLPGLVSISNADLSPEEIALIEKKVAEATDNAAAQLRQMRTIEGQSLMADIDGRIATIARHLETILAGANVFVEHYRQQLIARVTELAPQLAADSNRLEMEALLYAERCDVAEETTRDRKSTRLNSSHVSEFRMPSSA